MLTTTIILAIIALALSTYQVRLGERIAELEARIRDLRWDLAHQDGGLAQ